MDENKIQYRIVRRVANALGVNIEPPQTEPKVPAGADYLGSLVSSWNRLFGVELARTARYRDYDEMDYGLMSAQLDALVDACTISDDGKQYSFEIEAGTKYQGVIDRMVERTDLKRRIRPILRDLGKYGDQFVAPVFDEQYNIVAVETPRPHQMVKNVDKFYRLKRGTESRQDEDNKAIQLPWAFRMVNDAGHPVAGWLPWEMRHLRWDEVKQEHLSPTIYSSTSYFEPSRKTWHKLRMTEESLVIARLVRAYLRFIHSIDVTGKDKEQTEAAFKDYMQKLGRSKTEGGSYMKHPLEVDEDFFLGVRYRQDILAQELKPSLSKIEAIDPLNRGLSQIQDVEYLRDQLFSRMSSEIVGVQGDREDISQQDIASSRMYLGCQRLLTEDLIWPLLRLELLLKGYIAKREEVKIVWPDVAIRSSWRYSDAFFRLALGYRTYLESKVLPREYVAKQALKIPPEEWEHWVNNVFPDELAKLGPVSKADVSSQQAAGNLSTSRAGDPDLYDIVNTIVADILFGRDHRG